MDKLPTYGELKERLQDLEKQRTQPTQPDTAADFKTSAPMQSNKSYGGWLLGLLVVIAVVITFMDTTTGDRSSTDHINSPKPQSTSESVECQELERQGDLLAKSQNAQDDAATTRQVSELEALEKSDAPQFQKELARSKLAEKQDIEDTARNARQNREWLILTQKMKDAGCLSQKVER